MRRWYRVTGWDVTTHSLRTLDLWSGADAAAKAAAEAQGVYPTVIQRHPERRDGRRSSCFERRGHDG